MLITAEMMDTLGDAEMPYVPSFTKSPIVIGIDVARKHDSTVATAIWVDWEHPDEFGLYHHRILDTLELHVENWEAQYADICRFVSNYRVMRIGVDGQGMGGPVAERLQVLLPHIEVLSLNMNPADQSERWEHLLQLIQRRMIGWPANKSAKKTIKHKRFIHQLGNVEKVYRGKYLMVQAPENEKNAHDDYVDSLALGVWLTREFSENLEAEMLEHNPFTAKGHRRRNALT